MSPDLPDGAIEVARTWKRFRSDSHAHRGKRMADTLLGRRGSADGPDERWRWALRDVTFSVAPGESVAIVGRNGSGKSTLLKLVNGTMDPSAGNVAVAGRVGALIELQAGLHPELTGKENALAYGALLGLSGAGRREDRRRVGVRVLGERSQLAMRHEDQAHPARGQGEKDAEEE